MTHTTPIVNVTSVTDEQVPYIVAYINASVSLLLVVIVLIGNFLIILIFVKFKAIRNLNNTTVTLLSACDFLRGSIVMTTKIYNQYTLAKDLVEPLCTLTALTSAISFVFNPQLLALIAVIRYRTIAPISSVRFQLSRRDFNITLFALVLVSLIFAFLPFMGIGKYDYSVSHGVCFTDWSNHNRIFRSIFYTIVIGIAFPILAMCYSMLFKILKEHKRKMLSNYNSQKEKKENSVKTVTFVQKLSSGLPPNYRKNSKQNQDSAASVNVNTTIPKENISNGEFLKSTLPEKRHEVTKNSIVEDECDHNVDCEDRVDCDNDIDGDNGVDCDNSRNDNKKDSGVGASNDENRLKEQKERVAKHLSKQEYQVTILMIMIFIAYCVCWIPAAIVNIMALVDPDNVPAPWLYTIVTMVELKSALNPIIYGFGNRKYRRAFKRLVKQL